MLIFDLDGTLLNTIDDLHNSLNYALEKHHLPQKSLYETKMLLGNGIERLVADAIKDDKSNPSFSQIFTTFKNYYTAHINDHTKPYTGIIPLLQNLKACNIKTGIVSNKFDEGVKILTNKYFKNLINYAQGTSTTIKTKPSPDAIFTLIKKLHAEDENNIYIGDSEVDITTAQNANLPCICVSWGFRNKEQLFSSGATTIIDTPQELLKFIQSQPNL